MMDQWNYAQQLSSLAWGCSDLKDEEDERPEFSDDPGKSEYKFKFKFKFNSIE